MAAVLHPAAVQAAGAQFVELPSANMEAAAGNRGGFFC